MLYTKFFGWTIAPLMIFVMIEIQLMVVGSNSSCFSLAFICTSTAYVRISSVYTHVAMLRLPLVQNK